MRKPIGNVRYIRKWFKMSTIPRLKTMGYKSLVEIDNCEVISEWLNKCYDDEKNRHVQDELFNFIENSKR